MIKTDLIAGVNWFSDITERSLKHTVVRGLVSTVCVCAGVRGQAGHVIELVKQDVIRLRITASVCPLAGHPSVGGSGLSESVLAENESTASSQIALGAPVVPQYCI